jgi:hypothetical protein
MHSNIQIMNRPINLLAVLSLALLFSCKTSQPATIGDPKMTEGFGYQPIDPLATIVKLAGVEIDPLAQRAKVLDALPDETMRLAVGEVDGSGGISFGPAKIGYEGKSYVIVIDYIKFRTEAYSIRYRIKPDGKEYDIWDLTGTPDGDITQWKTRSFPLYLGVGLRIRATITVNKGSVDLGNLFAVGVAGQAQQVTGTMTVQTLGISGEKISSIIPMPSEISPATIQNAILAVGTIKSKIYDADTRVVPRVLGFYNSIGGKTVTVNNILSNGITSSPFINLK